MLEIYLPTHRLDPAALAKWQFRNYIVWYVAYSFGCTGALFYLLLSILDIRGWIPAACTLIVAPIILLSIRDNLSKTYRKKQFSQFQFKRTMKLDDEGFEFKYENGVFSRIPWTVVLKTKWTRDFLIIYTTLGHPLPVPVGILTAEARALIEEALARPKPETLPSNVV